MLKKYLLDSYVQALVPRKLEGSPSDLDYLMVVGMGGSGIVGRYLKVVAERSWGRPVIPVDSCPLSAPKKGRFGLIAVSYSGSTYETVEQFRELSPHAAASGVVTGGGDLLELGRLRNAKVLKVGGAPAPRFGFPQMLSATFSLFSWMSGDPAVADRLRDAATRLTDWVRIGESEDHVARLSEFAMSGLPLIYAAEHLSPVGYRWKTQLNENPKLSSFFSPLPEANHNEVNSSNPEGQAAIFLMSDNYSKCARAAAEAHVEVAKVAKYVEHIDEKDFLTEMLKLTFIGDLLSLDLAERLGVDALATPLIDNLKVRIGKILKTSG